MQPVVLIVEDDIISRMFLKNSFNKRTPYHIMTAPDGESAVAIAQEHPITILLTDIGLPGIDGIETARRIASRQDTQIIVVTGFTDDEMLTRVQQLSPFAIRTKPVNIDQIIELVRQAIEQSTVDRNHVLAPDFLLDTLYDTAEIGMCVTDENGCFVRINRAYSSTYGYSREELMGKEFTRVLPEEDRISGKLIHDKFIAGDFSEMPQDWRVQRKDGSVRNIYVTAGRMIGTDGKPYKVTTVSDVTDRQRNEVRLQRALEEKKLLVREVSHRVKNSLNTLTAMIQLQKDQLPSHSESSEALQTVANRIRAIGSVYQQLQRAESATEVNVQEYLANLVSDLSQSFQDPASTSMQVTSDAVTVDIDTAVIIGLIANELITNSLKYGQSEAHMLKITMNVHYENGVLAIEVSDTGPGLAKGFDPTQQNTLGLQLIHAMCGQRGRTVQVIDEKTAHFRVTIPYQMPAVPYQLPD